MKVTVLGSGTSIGVPEMGCPCAVCRSSDVRDKRLRTSVLVETDSTTLLMDCGPDFRQQALTHDLEKIDAVFITHEHYDHVGGLDDLRPFGKSRGVNLYAEELVKAHIMERMPYCFGNIHYPGSPNINIIPVVPGQTVRVNGLEVTAIRVFHGNLPILGFRTGGMAYITDMKSMDDSGFELLRNLDLLVVNALHIKEHATHQNLMQAIRFASQVGARRTCFVHMSHKMGLHAEVNKRLPENMELAFDGLSFTL